MAFNTLTDLRKRLVFKLILAVGLTLLLTISTWSYFSTRVQKEKLMENIVVGTDRLTNTIKLGTHYAMMLNSRDDINQIINNIGKQREIVNIRIYNKQGQIKFSNRPDEVDRLTNIKAEACDICHRTEPARSRLSLEERTRIFHSPDGHRLLGIISPILNEPSCSTDECHVHPEGKKVLGALDVVVSLAETDQELRHSERGSFALAGVAFLVTSAIILFSILRFVNQPVRKLIESTKLIGNGIYPIQVDVGRDDEMGQLATAINQMSREVAAKQAELNEQRDEYQTLFERAPCLITVQDRNYRLLRYNNEFAGHFAPEPGDFCFHAYKGRSEKCVNCPVDLTFTDGLPHYSEEQGVNKDGTRTHWMVRTSPIKNAQGEIVAAMEMSLDITERKLLEGELEKSERKYHGIFNHIPNPVFVLDNETLEIIDCNESVRAVYGYERDEIQQRSFLVLFPNEEKDTYELKIRQHAVINQARNLNADGKTLYVNIRISPAEYPGRKVLLVTTSDITKRLEAEQQLIQASKMATLGEMATGVAHELNQPLSVIKTASSFFIKKIHKKEALDPDVLANMLTKIDGNVDRASRIINHMREFARKSDMDLEKVQLNEVLEKAFEIFSQQLKLRGIEVVWDIESPLPKINGDAGRLEQVFINLLLNARDAIEEKWNAGDPGECDKRIVLRTYSSRNEVICEVCDTGKGIPEGFADRIFEPFFTTKEVGKGTGLGLSISYGIVKDCGGTIRVAPNPPGGACFILTFPMAGKTDGKQDSSGR
jgi:histidine kinase